MRDKVFIVDDMTENRALLSEVLSDDYEIMEADNGVTAVDMLFNSIEMPSIILLDIMMPEMDGFEVLNIIKSNTATKDIPVLFITASDIGENETKWLKGGAVDYMQKPFIPEVVKARVDNYVQLYHYKTGLEKMVDDKTRHLIGTHEKMLETLATIIEYRSLESGSHIRRTCELTRTLINQLLKKPMFAKELADIDYEAVIKASALHDIGKIGIPETILLKPGRLTPAEFEIIKTHSIIGSNIIDSLKFTGSEEYLKNCRDICRHHHERWDGTGYPDKLRGLEIPLSARIVSIVDVYDALVSKRCYKIEFSLDETYSIIRSGSGTQFQPEIVEALIEVHAQFERIEAEMTDPIIE